MDIESMAMRRFELAQISEMLPPRLALYYNEQLENRQFDRDW
jgi:hypothetical protein